MIPDTQIRHTDLAELRNVDDLAEVEGVPLFDRTTAQSTYDLLLQSARDYGDRPALTFLPTGMIGDEPEIYSYADFLRIVTQTANLLSDLGATSSDAISLLMPNLPETHFMLWGAEAVAVANPINPMLAEAEISGIMKAADARFLVTPSKSVDAELWAKATAVQQHSAEPVTLIVVRPGPDDQLPDSAVAYDPAKLNTSGDSLQFARSISREDIAAYFHTGGTTGTPKLAQHTHGNEIADAWMASYSFGFREGDVTLTGLPLFHANASIISGIAALSKGVHVLLVGKDGFRNKQTIRDFWKLVEKYRVTNFSAVPTIYAALMDVPIEGADVSSLRFCICGAAPMPTSLFSKFEQSTGITILEAYGMTESTCVSTCNPRDGERRLGSIGIRLPYQKLMVALVDDHGDFEREAAIDEVGVLCLKGPNVIPGYKQTKANRDLWVQPGWLNTGDLARIDADGYVWLTGRAKDLIIRGGHNIDPQMIEDVLTSHPAVEVAAAIGRPDAYAGEVPIAYVSLTEGQPASPEELTQFCRENVPERPAAPAEVIVLDALPVTAVGKLFKPALRIDATERVVRETLSGSGIEAQISAKIEKERGLVVTVAPHDDSEGIAESIEDLLSGFAFILDIRSRE